MSRDRELERVTKEAHFVGPVRLWGGFLWSGLKKMYDVFRKKNVKKKMFARSQGGIEKVKERTGRLKKKRLSHKRKMDSVQSRMKNCLKIFFNPMPTCLVFNGWVYPIVRTSVLKRGNQCD